LILVMGIVFWSCLGMIFYIYVGYPILVFFLAQVIKKKVNKGSYEPMVTFLIAAFNEEKHIGQTIENKLQLNYPLDKLEIIVISDESNDRTDEIVNSFDDCNVRLLRQQHRAGKTSALNMAVPQAKGEILVFSDANSIYASDALRYLVENFYDPQVGYVTGRMIYTDSDGTLIGDGCSTYMKYENFLREMETSLGSVVGVDGGLDAMRNSLHSRLNSDQLPDFVQPLKVVKQGCRVVYEPKAILREASLQEAGDEYRMRVRVSLRTLWALKDMHTLLWGRGGIVFAWQLWSHKVLRYLCFVFLIGALSANLVLAVQGNVLFLSFLVIQLTAYNAAILGMLLQKMGIDLKVIRLGHYFLLLNIASAHAVCKFILGKKQVVWTPRKG